MIEIQVNNLVKSFEVGHNVLDGVTFQIDQGQRVGLLGKNGAGKSTLFKILIGELDCDEGTVTISPGHRMGLISQIPVYPEGYTVDDVLRSAFGRLHALTAEMEELAGRMAAGETDPAILKRYGSLSERFEVFGGYDTDVAISKVANGLSISDDMRGRLFDQLSGGEKTRVNLGRLILEDTDILLLDEPINGLDPEGIVEFRNLLLRLNQERQTTILISSHILSELANLATCYGFLDNGMMLEQISARALEEKCRACIEARVDDASRAALVLEQSLGIRDYEVLPGHLLRIYSSLDAPHRVAQALVEGGVALQSIESRGANLEDYFLSMIGGVRHA